jgi:hypothetical protein
MIRVEGSAGRGPAAHPARDSCTCDRPNQNQEKPSYERKNKPTPRPPAGRKRARCVLRKDLTKNLHELPLAR